MEELYKNNFYPNAKRFYEILKENNIRATHKEVKEFIDKQAVSQVHKPVLNIKSQEKPIVAVDENSQMQIDLIDYYKYKKSNRNNAYILIGIDIYTRKGYASPIKTKTPENVLNGFKKFGVKPFMLLHDDGNEFKGVFKKYIEENNINDVIINSRFHHTLGVIDRFTKTLKNTIEKVFTSKNTTNWLYYLNDILENYNRSPNEGIHGVVPFYADDEENEEVLSNLNFWKSVKNNQVNSKQEVSKVKVGDFVRVKTDKGITSKGYANTYSKRVYIVESIHGNKAKLDTERSEFLKDLLVVPEGSVSLKSNKQDKANKDARVKRRLRKEGLI